LAARASYRERLRRDLGELIDELDLPTLQKHFLRSRWLDQVVWLEERSDSARVCYYALRLTTVVGGVIVPALVSLNVSGNGPVSAPGLAGIAGWGTIILSLLVAIAAAVEELFHFGERWRHYRRTAEWLKSEGWQFFPLSGPYRRFATHLEAYPAFAARLEAGFQRDVDVYLTDVAREHEERREREPIATP
jgi:hypothetical protein